MSEGELIVGLTALMAIALIGVCYPLRKSIFICTLLSFLSIGSVGILYWCWGDWSGWTSFTRDQAKQKQAKALLQSIHDPEELINKLKNRVESEPNRAKGWYLLGRLYASQGEWKKARDVYYKAHVLEPNNEQTTVNYAQSLWQLNNQKFNDKSRKLLQAVLDRNPEQPDALAMLAMDAFSGKCYQQAIDYWERLLERVPPGSEDAKAIRKAIAKAQNKLL
jgi:cytochrome c-type biogenesis protein CcmH/NrfG